jgi:hypothetical protein
MHLGYPVTDFGVCVRSPALCAVIPWGLELGPWWSSEEVDGVGMDTGHSSECNQG